jgi:hypothetical protein
MPHSQVTVRIRRPAAVVFDAIEGHAWRNDPAWEPEVLEVRPEETGPLRLGSRATMVRKESGRVSSTTFEIVALDPPHRLAARHLDGPMGFAIDFAVRPVDDGTSDVMVTVDMTLRGPIRLLTPLFALMGPRRNALISRRMAAAIEAATVSRHSPEARTTTATAP